MFLYTIDKCNCLCILLSRPSPASQRQEQQRSPYNQRRNQIPRQQSFQNLGYWKGSQGSNLDYDYSDFQMCRDYISSSFCNSHNDLSRTESTGFMSENNYSAITPEVSRKLNMSVIPQPKNSNDFGFVSSKSKKESVPKPPRRTRSKDGSRPGSFSYK